MRLSDKETTTVLAAGVHGRITPSGHEERTFAALIRKGLFELVPAGKQDTLPWYRLSATGRAVLNTLKDKT